MLSLPFESQSLHATTPAPVVPGSAEESCCAQSGCTCSAGVQSGRPGARAGTGVDVSAGFGAGAIDRPRSGALTRAESRGETRAESELGFAEDRRPAGQTQLAPVIPLRPRQRVSTASQDREAGMATAEYAIATLAAVAFAGLLVAVLSSGDVRELLLALIRGALSFG